jgi:hypothetical protein
VNAPQSYISPKGQQSRPKTEPGDGTVIGSRATFPVQDRWKVVRMSPPGARTARLKACAGLRRAGEKTWRRPVRIGRCSVRPGIPTRAHGRRPGLAKYRPWGAESRAEIMAGDGLGAPRSLR